MKNQSSRSLRRLALGLAGLGLLQGSALAQFDSEITNISVTQAIQNNSVEYVAGRTMFVRVETAVSGAATPVDLDGLMRVFVNGVEAADSPVFSFNGPYPAQSSSNLNLLDGTLNFIYIPPISDNVLLTIELNPAGPNFVPEVDLANNTMNFGPVEFFEKGTPEWAYSPIDYRPTGGGANVPSATLLEPGMGDNFLLGIMPAKDIYYHRTDAPSKLWTNSLSGTGTGLLSSLSADWNLMVPRPDFLYGWVPGGLPYNGQAFLNSPVAMGNTQSFKYQRTYAHEVGHNLGRNHVNLKIAVVGIDSEHHLALPASNNLGMAKGSNLNDIMVAGLNTNQAWVRANFYNYAFGHSIFQPNDDQASGSGSEGTASTLILGSWNSATGAVQLSHVLDLPEPAVSTASAAGKGEFTVAAYAGGALVYSASLAPGSELDACAQTGAADTLERMVEVPIQVVVPRGATPIDRIEIAPADGVQAQSVTLLRSAHAPEVSFLNPLGDVSAGLIEVSWTGVDQDGDPLAYYLRYTRNGEQFTPLATAITATSFTVDLRELPALVDGLGYFQLLASDGLNTTVVDSPFLTGGGNLFANVSNPPWVEIVTPDNDTSALFGAPVILHSSGWDLEDRGLGDAAISWSSNLDGALGGGRLLSVDDLSVGLHTLTVTAVDSDGEITTDTALLGVLARSLPNLPTGPEVYCTAGTSASGCQALIASTGTPSATAASGFTLDVASVEGNKDGQFFYGTTGRQANTWGSGTSFQCVIPPTKRGGVQTGVGNNGACDGTYSQDLNARWQAKPAHNPGAGAVVQAQFWYRDPQNTSNQTTSLSDAIEFTVEP